MVSVITVANQGLKLFSELTRKQYRILYWLYHVFWINFDACRFQGSILSLCAQLLSPVWLFATPWTIVCQAPLSMGFSRQKYWSGLPFPPPGDLPEPRIGAKSPATPALSGKSFTTKLPRKPILSLLLNCCKVASVVSDSVQPRRWQPTRLPHPWDSPGKNTGVGCHFVL